MTELHPLTQTVVKELEGRTYDRHAHDDDVWQELLDSLDEHVRDYVEPPALVAESGVRFPDLPDIPVEVAGNFITSGTQMQMVLVGSEPVLVVQPEFDAEEGRVTLITTAVDLPPAGLVHVLEALLDGARTIVQIQEDQAVEFEVAVKQRARDLQAAGPDEFPTGYYEHLAREQIIAENAPVDPEQAEADEALREVSAEFEAAEQARRDT